MKYEAGDKIERYDDYRTLPVGTVVLSQMSTGETRIKTGPEEWTYVRVNGKTHVAHSQTGGLVAGNTIVYIPEVPTDSDPRTTKLEELAAELWEVRQQTAATLDIPSGALVQTADHRAVYRALAEFVLAREEDPAVVWDGDGDPWYQDPSNGLYNMSQDEEGYKTLEDIRADFGIQGRGR